MRLHRRARTRRIVTLDRIQNSLVMMLAALRPAADAENPQALFAQQSDDGIDQRQNDGIGRRLGKSLFGE